MPPSMGLSNVNDISLDSTTRQMAILMNFCRLAYEYECQMGELAPLERLVTYLQLPELVNKEEDADASDPSHSSYYQLLCATTGFSSLNIFRHENGTWYVEVLVDPQTGSKRRRRETPLQPKRAGAVAPTLERPPVFHGQDNRHLQPQLSLRAPRPPPGAPPRPRPPPKAVPRPPSIPPPPGALEPRQTMHRGIQINFCIFLYGRGRG